MNGRAKRSGRPAEEETQRFWLLYRDGSVKVAEGDLPEDLVTGAWSTLATPTGMDHFIVVPPPGAVDGDWYPVWQWEVCFHDGVCAVNRIHTEGERVLVRAYAPGRWDGFTGDDISLL